MKRARYFAWAAVALLFVAATIELVMIATEHHWTRFGARHNYTIMLLVAMLFAVSGIVILLRKRSAGLARAAFVLGVVSTVALFAHSLVGLGVIYLPFAIAVGALLFTTFRREWHELRWTATHRGEDLGHRAR